MIINVLKILLAVGVLALLFYFYVRYLERRTTYQPSRIIESNPSSIGLSYEDIYFETSDNIRLNGWFIPSEKTKLTLIFCHGNGGNISHRMDKILFFNKLGLNQFIFDYRGYGLSQGTPSEEGLYRDVEAAYEYLKIKMSDEHNIIIYGASLGGAVAVDLVSKYPVDGLILEGTFASAVDISREFYPLIPTFMVNLKFDSFAKIQNINIPKLIMHSESDDIIPFNQGQKLFENALEPKKFLKLNGGHNEAFFVSEAEVKATIKLFLNSIEH
ncbi:MAG: alpha/beta hydrolase [candidate division Zixibacteria bacterium]|nr:alpha/beta hydrolase [candidate division Zixibacteria bacterium]